MSDVGVQCTAYDLLAELLTRTGLFHALPSGAVYCSFLQRSIAGTSVTQPTSKQHVDEPIQIADRGNSGTGAFVAAHRCNSRCICARGLLRPRVRRTSRARGTLRWTTSSRRCCRARRRWCYKRRGCPWAKAPISLGLVVWYVTHVCDCPSNLCRTGFTDPGTGFGWRNLLWRYGDIFPCDRPNITYRSPGISVVPPLRGRWKISPTPVERAALDGTSETSPETLISHADVLVERLLDERVLMRFVSLQLLVKLQILRDEPRRFLEL